MRIALIVILASGCATYTVDANTLARVRSLDDDRERQRIAVPARADEVPERKTWLRADRIIFARPADKGRVRVRSRSPLIPWGAIVFSVGATFGIAAIAVANEPDPPFDQCELLCINRDKLVALPILIGIGGPLMLSGVLMTIIGVVTRTEVAPNRADLQYTGP